ncbi:MULTISPECIES: hypothetical protein [Prevotellaceae]|uniref:hypothetical protein n=1 Tax=Prevotellaceae TaxID=171552 RepID=UPI0003D3AFC8|nr:hypothetical protein [Prevotella phocaeensis]ETD16940.1 hypothetical protein HMPREF1199_01975 [Hoylesella oralis CC98A]
MQKTKKFTVSLSALWVVSALLLLSSCYHKKTAKSDALVQYSERQLDSLSFQSTHHYTNNYNFIVKSDSLVLLKQQPEEMISGLMTDSLVLRRHEHVVVADIRMISTDSIDSVWVQLASDQHTFGWIHETEMLPKVVPDDPISQFISTFSDVHLLIFLVVISIIAVTYWIRKLLRQRARIVHFRDIDSFYPTLLCLLVASSAALYASIQMFAPDVWRHFYYHPTLNPFGVPAILSVFLLSVWAMLIVGIAAVDDVRHRLPFGEAVQYLSGLVAVCAADYIIFSISTLYYIGYILLAVYFMFAIHRYVEYGRARYVCGNCGATLSHKGRCPHCGAVNS